MTPTQPPAREAEEPPEAQLTELHLDERGLEFRMKHPIVPIIAEHLAEAFKDAGGVNYVAFDVNCDDIGPLVLIMQRRLGETPEMQVRRMRVELDEARAVLATISGPLVARERERCAKIAENPGFIEARDTAWDEGVNYAKQYIAAAIRTGAPDAR